jgi:hypothetical protein
VRRIPVRKRQKGARNTSIDSLTARVCRTGERLALQRLDELKEYKERLLSSVSSWRWKMLL